MRRMFTKTLQCSSLFILFLMGACGEDFLPENLLSESRILAVVAEPIEAGFKDNVTLKPVIHLPEGATIVSETWTFCPITLGSNFAFQCVVEACETVVTASETPLGVVSEDPGSRLFDCAINHLAPKASEEEVTSGAEALKEEEDDLPEIVETVFRYRAVIEETLADGSVQEVTRKSLTRIKLHTEEPPTNQNPVIESILVDELEVNLEEIETGITLSGASEKIDVCDKGSCEKSLRPFSFKINVLESSLDSYFNDIDDTDKTEEPDMMFYVTAGRFVAEDSGLIVEGDWTFRSLTEEQEQTLMAGSLEALLYVVVRDGQGGTSAYGPYKFTVEP